MENTYYWYRFFAQFRATRMVLVLYITQTLGVSIEKYSSLQSLYFLIILILGIPLGILTDYLERKTSILIGHVLSIISLLLMTLLYVNYSNEILIFAYVISSVSSILIYNNVEAFLFDMDDLQSKSHEKILGGGTFYASISLGIATYVGLALFPKNNLLPFYFEAGCSFLSILLIRKLSKNINSMQINNEKLNFKMALINIKKELRILYSNKKTFLFTLFLMGFSIGFINIIINFSPAYLLEYSFSENQIGILFMMFSLFSSFGSKYIYLVSEKFGYKIVFFISLMLMVLGVCLTFLNNKISILLGICSIYAIINIIGPSVYTIINKNINNSIRSTVSALYVNFSSLVNVILFPIVGANIVSLGYRFMIITLGSLISIGMILLIYLAQSKKFDEN